MVEPRIIFDYPPAFILLCIALGIGYAYLLYSSKYSWSKPINRILFILRAALACFLAMLLLGPIVKHVNNLFEKPLFVLVYDDSASIKEASDSSALQAVKEGLFNTQTNLQSEYDVESLTVSGAEAKDVQFTASTSDLTGSLKEIANRFEGRKIAGVVLVSDGIYNTGISPLYATYNFPIHTIGIGDTAIRNDLAIKNIAYNKVAYQGNKFPIRVDVITKGYASGETVVSLLHKGKVLEKKVDELKGSSILSFDFTPEASEKGIQRFDIQVAPRTDEMNTKNNFSSIFIEVVEGKKKILLVAQSPHPDIKAFREVVEKNSNYEFLLHLPGVTEIAPADLQPEKIDLAIFHQSPDLRGINRNLFDQFVKSKTSLFLVVGSQTDLQEISRQGLPFGFESPPRSYDEVTAAVNTNFSSFTLSTEVNTMIAEYPPVTVHFGKTIPSGNISLLTQRIGSVISDRPLLSLSNENDRKIGFLLGDGVWRWRLFEYDRTESATAFDELFGKLFQYLSITDDKRKFRSYPTKQEFPDTAPVIFESQVYNDIYEPVFGNTVALEITNEQGATSKYTYVLSPGNTQYQIGGLTEGVYRYTSKTELEGKPQLVRGEFAVLAQQAELQDLTADFNLLRQLSANTGGSFYTQEEITRLLSDLQEEKVNSVIRSEETFKSMLNLQWVLATLLLLISVEWFLRKFYGSY